MRTVIIRFLTFVAVLSALLSACQKSSGGKQVLSDEQMVRILADMHIAEVASRSYPDSLRDTLLVQVFDEVYQKHETSKNDFELTLRYLSHQPEYLEVVYDSVQMLLKRRQKNPDL